VKLLRDRTRAAMVAALDELRGAPGAAERPTVQPSHPGGGGTPQGSSLAC
jgi:hypothetical protein